MTPFICSLVKQPNQTGIAISEHLIPVPDASGGIKLTSLIGVLWDEKRAPSPSYHDPSDLAWLSVPSIADPDEEDETDEDETDEDETDDENA